MAESVFISKIRYGLQLLGKVRCVDNATSNSDLDDIQKIQNKLVACLNNVNLSDRQTRKSLLQKSEMLSVNQINAGIKLTELWKAINNKECPLIITKPLKENPLRMHSSRNENKLEEIGKSDMVWSTFIHDGIKMWNSAPVAIQNSVTLYKAKKEIRTLVKTLPI